MPVLDVKRGEAVEDQIDKPRGELIELNDKGDVRLEWAPSNTDEVTAARETFTRLKGRGFMAYSDSHGKREVIHDFDPSAERIVMAPPMQGGL